MGAHIFGFLAGALVGLPLALLRSWLVGRRAEVCGWIAGLLAFICAWLAWG